VTALAGMLWGTSFVAMKIGLEYVDPYSFAFLRLLGGSVLSAAFMFSVERPSAALLRDRMIWVLGALNAVGFIFQNVGLTYTTATRTALIVNSNLAVTALLSWRIHHEPMGLGKLLALPSAILGVFLLTTGGDLSTLSGGQATGDLLVLLAGLIWSLFIVLNKGAVSRKGSEISQIVTWVMLVTAVIIAPFTFTLGSIVRSVIPWEGWLVVAYTAVFCTFIPYLFLSKALRFVSATVSSLVLLIEIIMAIVSSALILGEQFAVGSGLGAALVLASIILASRGSGAR